MKWFRIFSRKKRKDMSIRIEIPPQSEDPYISISPNGAWKIYDAPGEQDGIFSFCNGIRKSYYPIPFIDRLGGNIPISNNGEICFVSSHRKGKIDSSVLYIGNRSKMYRLVISGFFRNSFISNDGTVCAIKGSTTDHKAELALFSTQSGEEISSFLTNDFLLDDIENILPEKEKIILHSKDLGSFSFSFVGKIENEKAYIDAELHKGNLHTVCSRINKILKFTPKITDPDLMRELLICLDRAHPPKFSDQKWNTRSILENRIAIFERMKNYSEALKCAEELATQFPTRAHLTKRASLRKRLKLSHSP